MNETSYKLFHAVNFCILLILLLFVSCKKTSNTPTYDVTDARISGFSFASNDSFPGLAAAKFIVEQRVDTGYIGLDAGDSIRYGTSLARVVPRLSFMSVPAAAIYYMGDTSRIMTGYDTLNFMVSPIYVRVFAHDREHEKWYRIDPRVHQIDPYLYNWTRLQSSVAPEQFVEQQALLLKDTLYLFRNDGTQTWVYTSVDGVEWTSHLVDGLPDETHVRRMVTDTVARCFCYADTAGIFTSEDGREFTLRTDIPLDNFLPQSAFFAFDGRMWFSMLDPNREARVLTFLSLADATVPLTEVAVLTDDFPVSDYAVTSYVSTSGLPHLLVAGGYNQQGKMLNHIWSLEASNHTYRMADMSTNTRLSPFAGVAMVRYGDKLLWFGGINQEGHLRDTVLYSLNEGITWAPADTAWHILPQGFGARQRVSVLQQKNNLFLIGGQNHSTCFSDAYRGRLNSITWYE